MNGVVLFTQRVELVESYNERRDCADQRISRFIENCGFLPVPVPNKLEIVREMVGNINAVGIILTGGNSLVKYGGNAAERDDTDKELIDYAIRKHLPLYGFCRGMQSILDFFGTELQNVNGHVAVRHIITGSDCRTEVNSFHNQGCLKLKSDALVAVMKSEDGVIEKIRHNSLPIVGTMWHPERENPFKESDISMVRDLFLRTNI